MKRWPKSLITTTKKIRMKLGTDQSMLATMSALRENLIVKSIAPLGKTADPHPLQKAGS